MERLSKQDMKAWNCTWHIEKYINPMVLLEEVTYIMQKKRSMKLIDTLFRKFFIAHALNLADGFC